MTHLKTTKRLAAIAMAVALIGVSASPASAARHARAMHWTPQQLDQLARAYAKKNPGWTRPDAASAALTPAQKTWTPAALDALAQAYAAKNPGWTRP